MIDLPLPPAPVAMVRQVPDAPKQAVDFQMETLIGLGLFVASELIGMSPKLRSNSLLQLVIQLGGQLFPYELKRKGMPAPLTPPAPPGPPPAPAAPAAPRTRRTTSSKASGRAK